MSPEPEHGTPKGYAIHLTLVEVPCQPCKDAHAARMRQWRATHADTERARARARTAALGQLAREYPARYRALRAEYLAEQEPQP